MKANFPKTQMPVGGGGGMLKLRFDWYIRIYIEKSNELKLTGIALNRSKNHIGETTTDKGVQVRIFF